MFKVRNFIISLLWLSMFLCVNIIITRFSSPVLPRILLYSGSLALHLGNGVAMGYSLYFGQAMQNPTSEMITFRSMSFRFITIWNVVFHLVHAALGLGCEIYDLKEKQKWQKERQIAQKIRDILFCGILFPVSVLIFSIFWPFYIYDRELIFQSFIDLVLSQISNHIMHTSILFIVLFELMCNPRKADTHLPYVIGFNFTYFIYLAVLFLTRWQFDAYPYPILDYFSNIQLAAFLLAIYILGHISYTIQWLLTPVFTMCSFPENLLYKIQINKKSSFMGLRKGL